MIDPQDECYGEFLIYYTPDDETRLGEEATVKDNLTIHMEGVVKQYLTTEFQENTTP